MTRHRLPLRTPAEKARAKAWIDKATQGWSIEFRAPIRSTDQNRRLWAFLDDIAAQQKWEGKKRSSEAWKDLFSACLKTQEIVRGLEGGIVALGARTSEMSPQEMSDLLQLIEAWGVQNGIVFTDTNTASGSERASGSDGALAGVGLDAREPEERE